MDGKMLARLGAVGDRIIIMAFAMIEAAGAESHQPRVVALDAKNRIAQRIEYPPLGEAADAPFQNGREAWAETI